MIWAIVIILLLVVVTAFALDRSWNNVTLEDRNRIVFENKNKLYGAFSIRKEYNKTLMLALVVSSAFVIVTTAGPALLSGGDDEGDVKIVTMDQVKLVEPPPVNKEELPPPPPPPPPPPMIKQIQFTEPEVTEEVVEEIPPSQEEVKDTKIGTFTQEGEDVAVAPIDPGDVGGDDNQIFTFVEQQPAFPGGEAAMMKYLMDNIKYPAMEADNGIQGTVVLTFVVDQNGGISDIKTLKGVKGGPNLEKEAMRVVKSMPAWKPGKMNGKAVKVQFNLPVRFTLR